MADLLTNKCSCVIMQSQETKQKTERRVVPTNKQNNNMTAEKRRRPEGVTVFSYCDHCGFAIYDASDAYIVKGSEDRIHRDCFSEYMEEHMFWFVKPAGEDDGADCEF